MISDKAFAAKVLEETSACFKRYNELLVEAQKTIPQEEFDQLRIALGMVLGEAFLHVEEPIYKAHPELEPEELRRRQQLLEMRRQKQPNGLIAVLLDRSAEFGDRHDAAMDLAFYDDPAAISALESVISDPAEDPDTVEEAEQSLIEIRRENSTN